MAQPQVRPSLVLACLLSAAVLLTAFLPGIAGIWLIALGPKSVLAYVYGIPLLLLCWGLLPRRHRVPEGALTREDAPVLFGLCDRLSAAMDAPKIDAIEVIGGFNAYAAEPIHLRGGKVRVLGIGIPLWEYLDEEERIAVLSHEIAHLTNRDPARRLMLGYAKETLSRWAFWFQPNLRMNPYRDLSLAEQILEFFQYVFGAVLRLIWNVLNWTMMYHSQVAEYVADARSAEVAGRAAMLSALQKLLLGDNWYRSAMSVRMSGKPRNGWIFDHISKALRATPPERLEQKLQQAVNEKSALDQSHPPTVYRMAFLDHLAERPALVRFTEGEADKIAQELAPMKDQLGAMLVRELGAMEQ